MWQVYVLMAGVVAMISLMWVSAIDYMRENHPEYKGGQDGFDFDELEDWDVTVADGLDELEKDE